MQCADKTYYTGITNNLEKRLQTHNSGKGARYTSGRLPVILVYKKDNLTENQARKYEFGLKKLSRNEKEKVISSNTLLLDKDKKSKFVDIKTPVKSVRLAEFVGIMIGDGGITDYQISITLHCKDDKDYSIFVVKLLKELFRIEPSKNYRQSVVNIRISRKNLVDFCQKIGLKKGNKIKQSVDIPDWIKTNSKYSVACLRGLVDTDGSIYNHQYISKNKQYTYKNISFTSRSPVLLSSVKLLLEQIKLKPKYGSRSDIKLYNKADIASYFRIIGSNNPKHIKRYK